MIGILYRCSVACLLLGCTVALHAQDPASSRLPSSFLNGLQLFEEDDSESARGERRDEIETDRDSFTPSISTTGKGLFIFESAYTFLDNRGYKETHSFPEALLRYGLTKRLELRLGTNYEVGGAGSEVSGSNGGGEEFQQGGILERESNLSYGLKYRLTEGEGIIPGSSIMLMGFTPTRGNTTNTQFAGTYVFGWELPYRMKLDAAFRYFFATEETDHFNEWAPSVVLKVPVGESINVHAEYFGIFSTNKAEAVNHQYFSPGVHYLFTENFEVGVRVGFGLNDQTPRFFSNVGFGVRF